MDSDDLILDEIRMLLVLLKHRSICLCQKVGVWLEEPSRPAIDCKRYIRQTVSIFN